MGGRDQAECLGLSWVAREDRRHRLERDAAQAGLNEAAGRELKRLWGLRAPQTCAIRGQVQGDMDGLARSRVGAVGSVCNNSGIVRRRGWACTGSLSATAVVAVTSARAIVRGWAHEVSGLR